MTILRVVVVVCLTLIMMNAAASSFFLNSTLLVRSWYWYKMKYGKSYTNTTVETFRMKIFVENMIKIKQHNKLYAAGKFHHKIGINQFTDMLDEEVAKMTSSYVPDRTSAARWERRRRRSSTLFVGSNGRRSVPKEKDWRDDGVVSEVKNQGHCAACWAFSAAGALEGMLAIKKNKTIASISAQNFIDCSGQYGNHGCKGGNMNKAFEYVYDNGGVDVENEYSYEEKDKNSCRYDPAKSAGSLSQVKTIQNDEKSLQHAVAVHGPVAAAMDARNLHKYTAGIYSDPDCDSSRVNHAVLVVGYGTDSKTKKDYWIVKNSWGKDWGENGYFRLLRGCQNHCGIATDASVPIDAD